MKPHVAFLTDIFAESNNLNFQLQCDEISLIKPKSSISGFMENLPFYRENIESKNFTQLSCFKKKNTFPYDDTLLIFMERLKKFEIYMKWRFGDLSALHIPSCISYHY